MRIYNEDGELIENESGTCSNRTRCWTQVIEGHKDAAGISACFQPTLASGKNASVVIVQGAVPPQLAQVEAKAADKTCVERKAEFVEK